VNKTKNKMARRKRTALRGPGALAFPEIWFASLSKTHTTVTGGCYLSNHLLQEEQFRDWCQFLWKRNWIAWREAIQTGRRRIVNYNPQQLPLARFNVGMELGSLNQGIDLQKEKGSFS
jgi:hypothetical protein